MNKASTQNAAAQRDGDRGLGRVVLVLLVFSTSNLGSKKLLW